MHYIAHNVYIEYRVLNQVFLRSVKYWMWKEILQSILFPHVVSISVSIGVVSGREGTFRVTCTATGGTLSTSSLTGPGLGGGGLQLQAEEGSIGRTGQNTYSVTSDPLSRRSNGDTYTCTAMNDVNSPVISERLAGNPMCFSQSYIIHNECTLISYSTDLQNTVVCFCILHLQNP